MKRIIALLILLFLSISLFYIIFSNQYTDLTAAHRSINEINADVIYIDDEAIALAGSPSADIELREIAVAAYELTNQYRQTQNLVPLRWSERLAEDALVRSEEIERVFSHTRPNKSDWFTVDSVHMFGENLAQGFDDADSVVSAWLLSPSHQANMYDVEFQTCGIAVWRGSDGVLYYAQEFGY